MLMATFHLFKECKFIEKDGLDFTLIDCIWVHNWWKSIGSQLDLRGTGTTNRELKICQPTAPNKNILPSNFGIVSICSEHLFASELAQVKHLIPVFNSKRDYDKLFPSISVLHKTKNLVISLCGCAENGKEMHLSKTIQSTWPLLFYPWNLLFWYHSRCRRCPGLLNLFNTKWRLYNYEKRSKAFLIWQFGLFLWEQWKACPANPM